MTKEEAKTGFTKYLKSNFIKFHEQTENGVNTLRYCNDLVLRNERIGFRQQEMTHIM